MKYLREPKNKFQRWSTGGFVLLLTVFSHVASIGDDGKSQEPVATVGGESYVTLRSVLSNGERLVELARVDNKQTAYRFVLDIDAEQVEITPGPKDQIKIDCAGLEMLTDQVVFRTNLEKLKITATVALNPKLRWETGQMSSTPSKSGQTKESDPSSVLSPALNRYDKKELQGRWIVEAYSEGSLEVKKLPGLQLLITEDSAQLLGGNDVACIWQMDAQNIQTESSKTNACPVDFVIDPNGEHIVCPGILQLDGDRLRICFNASDVKSKEAETFRPSQFVPGSKVILLECSRVSHGDASPIDPPQTTTLFSPSHPTAEDNSVKMETDATVIDPFLGPPTCKLMELVKPGTVDVEVNIGLNGGIKPGDKLDAIYQGQTVARVEIMEAQALRSKARIIEVIPGKALEQYQVTWKEMAQELKSFEGTWSYDVQEMWHWPAPIGLAMNSEGRASEQRWQIDVSRNQITWVSQSAEPIYATFTIDPFKSPKEIDITIQSGPFKGMTSHGIYEFPKTDEYFLWLCMTNPGSDAPRPTDITSGSSLQQTMIGLHKIDPSEAITNENPINRFQGEFVMELCNSVDQRLHGNQAELQDWRWQVSGNEILWTRGSEEWKLKFSVDGTNNPKTIDLTFVSGPLKGQTWLGAYKWGGNDDNTLIMEFQHPSLDLPRPREVARTSENRPLLIFLRPKPKTLVVNELNSLQGTWTLRNYDTGAWPLPGGKRPDQFGKGSELRWTVRGNEIAWLDENGAEIKATFTIDTSFSPKHFDLTFLSGPNSGKVCKGIYQRGNVAMDMLWICIADPTSSSDRPKFFSAKHEAGHSLLSLFPYQPSAKP